MSNSTVPECIVLSSDSENENKSREDFSSHKSKPKGSNYAGTSSSNVKPESDSKNPLISQKISVNNDTLTVKLVTKFHNNFSGIKSTDDVPNARLSKSNAIRRIQASSQRRVELSRANDSPANKFMLNSCQSSNKMKFHQTHSKSSSDDDIVEVKKSKNCGGCGEAIKNPRPPESLRQFFPMIPLGKLADLNKKGNKPNLNAGFMNGTSTLDTDLTRSRQNLNTALVNGLANLGTVMTKLTPTLDANLMKSKSNADANLAKTKSMSLADMPDIKQLIDAYEKSANDDDDRLVAKLFQKKMNKSLINSIAEYDDVYQPFVLSVRRKITNNPSQIHIHLKDFYDEIKKCKKSKSELPLPVASTSNTLSEPKASTSKEPDYPNLPSLNINPDTKIAVLENKMKIIHRKITELQKKDIALDEMDDNSPYVMIEKYEKKYMQLSNCLRKLTEIPTSALRSVDKNFKYRGSRYPEFNSAVGKLVKRLKPDLPDYSDFYGLARKCNRRYLYRLSDGDVQSLARMTLHEVVEEIKKRRGYDFNDSLNMWLDYSDEQGGQDPAKTDENLKAQLKKNNLLARERTEEIIKQYAEKQEEFEKKFPEQHKKLVEHGEEDDNDEEEDDDDEGASDFELIDEEISKEMDNQTVATIDETETVPGDLPLSSESANETGDSSEKTDDENFSDLGEHCPSPDLPVEHVSQSSDGVLGLKIVSVEGAGNLFYSCESSPHKNYIFKCSTDETEDAEIVTLD